jgi:hypothetical protein
MLKDKVTGYAKDATITTFLSVTLVTCVIWAMRLVWRCCIWWILVIKDQKVISIHLMDKATTQCQNFQRCHLAPPLLPICQILSWTKYKPQWGESVSFMSINISTHTKFNHRMVMAHKVSKLPIWVTLKQHLPEMPWIKAINSQKRQMDSTLSNLDNQCLNGDQIKSRPSILLSQHPMLVSGN